MPTNFPGPCEFRMFYSTGNANFPAIVHTQRISFTPQVEPDVGDAFTTIQAALPGGGYTPMDTIADAWAIAVAALLPTHANSVVINAEIWKYAAGTFDATFISSYALDEAGNSGSALHVAGESIVTFRTTNGGVFKLAFLETVIATNPIDTGTFSNAALEALVEDIVTDGFYPWIGRDNGFPVVRLSHFPGENEALFRKRFRIR